MQGQCRAAEVDFSRFPCKLRAEMTRFSTREFKSRLKRGEITRDHLRDGLGLVIPRYVVNESPQPLTEQRAAELNLNVEPKNAYEWILNGPKRARDGDRTGRADLLEYRRNPVVQWAHNTGNILGGANENSLPIGRMLQVDQGEDLVVRGVLQFAGEEHSPIARFVEQQVKDGYLRMGSIGFRPTDFEDDEDAARADGSIKWAFWPLYYPTYEIVEFSIVPVGSYTDAFVQAVREMQSDAARSTMVVERSAAPAANRAAGAEGKTEMTEKKTDNQSAGGPEPQHQRQDAPSFDYDKLGEIVARAVAASIPKPEPKPEPAVEPQTRAIEGYEADEAARILREHKERELQAETRKNRVVGIRDSLSKVREEIKNQCRNDKHQGRGLLATRMFRAQALGMLNGMSPQDAAKRFWGDNTVGEMIEIAEGERNTRAQSSNLVSAGGALVPHDMSSEFVDILRNETAVLAANPREVDMPSGSLDLGRRTGSASASWNAEGAPIIASEGTFDNLVLVSKKITSLVPTTNEFLTRAGISADQVVRDDMVNVMAVLKDTTFIRGTGLTGAPKGFRYIASSASPDHVVATVGATAADINTDLKAAFSALRGANSRGRYAIFMSERELNAMQFAKGTDGETYFGQQILGPEPSLMGARIYTTNSIPTNLGGGDESEVYVVNMDHVWVGREGGIDVRASMEAAYNTSASSVTAAFSNDETVFRGTERCDMLVSHAESIYVITGVQWGA